MILFNLDSLSRVEKFLVDGGYSGEHFAQRVKDIRGARVEVVKRGEPRKLVVVVPLSLLIPHTSKVRVTDALKGGYFINLVVILVDGVKRRNARAAITSRKTL